MPTWQEHPRVKMRDLGGTLSADYRARSAQLQAHLSNFAGGIRTEALKTTLLLCRHFPYGFCPCGVPEGGCVAGGGRADVLFLLPPFQKVSPQQQLLTSGGGLFAAAGFFPQHALPAPSGSGPGALQVPPRPLRPVPSPSPRTSSVTSQGCRCAL